MPTKESTYRVVELIAKEPHLPDRFAFLEVGPAGDESMLACADTLEGLHSAVSVIGEADG